MVVKPALGYVVISGGALGAVRDAGMVLVVYQYAVSLPGQVSRTPQKSTHAAL